MPSATGGRWMQSHMSLRFIYWATRSYLNSHKLSALEVNNRFPNFPTGFLEVLVGKPASLYWESDT